MVILAVGLLAVAILQVSSMKANTNALSRTDGVAIAQSILDELRALPLDNDLLIDTDDDALGGLNDGEAVDGIPHPENADQSNALITGTTGQSYTAFWNIAEDPATESKTIRLFVYWTDQQFGLDHTIVTTTLGGLY